MRCKAGLTALAAAASVWTIGAGPSLALAGSSGLSVHVSTGGFGFHYGHHGRRYHGRHGHYGHGRYYGRHHGYGHYGYSHYFYPRYHGYSYSYGYRPSYTYYSYSTPPATRVYVPYPVERPTYTYVVPPAVTPPADDKVVAQPPAGSGWDLLADGRIDEARRRFGHDCQLNPQRGEPKAGYALATALAGRLERGVWAMRRAFRTDPHGVHYVSIDARLRPSVQKLARRYAYAEGGARADGPFMAAALHFLLRENEAAHDAITAAIEAGDRKSSTLNLHRLIEDEMRGEMRGEVPAEQSGEKGASDGAMY